MKARHFISREIINALKTFGNFFLPLEYIPEGILTPLFNSQNKIFGTLRGRGSDVRPKVMNNSLKFWMVIQNFSSRKGLVEGIPLEQNRAMI